MSKKKAKNPNNIILPLIAAALVITAMVIVFVLPEKSNNAEVADPDKSFIQIDTADLSSDHVSFIRLGGDSKIELLARKGDDGNPRVALGTCQSCNGSPGAYYTQEGDLLKCNNCGLTFPVSVLDEPGGGCHPIMIDEDMITTTANGITIDKEKLHKYEGLFAKVEAH